MIVFSFDPGAKGGMVVIYNDVILDSAEFDLEKYREILIKSLSLVRGEMSGLSIKPVAVVEEVHSMPGQGVKSMFSFGQRFGEIVGLLTAFDVEINYVKPTEWVKHYGLNKTTKEEKFNKAIEMEPKLKDVAMTKRGRIRDGISDAYLVGSYWIDKNKKSVK